MSWEPPLRRNRGMSTEEQSEAIRRLIEADDARKRAKAPLAGDVPKHVVTAGGRPGRLKTEIVEVAGRLIANGYEIIPVYLGSKRPIGDGWQNSPPATVEEFQARLGEGDEECNIGLVTRQLRAVDIDVPIAAQAEALAETVLEIVGPNLNRRVGSKGCLIPYRADVPRPKRSITYALPDGKRQALVEVLGDGQQFVAFGMHPSGKPYTWPSAIEEICGSPLWTPRADLPEADDGNVEKFLQRAAALAVEWGYPDVRLSGSGEDKGHATGFPVGEDYLIRLLAHVPADCSRDEWIARLGAIRATPGISEERRREIAVEWSRGDYDPRRRHDLDWRPANWGVRKNPETGAPDNFDGDEDTGATFDRLAEHRGDKSSAGFGTLYHAGRENGFTEPPPAPGAAEVFGPVEKLIATGAFDPFAPQPPQEIDWPASSDPFELLGEKRDDSGWEIPETFPAAIKEWAKGYAPIMGARPVPLAFAALVTASMATDPRFRLQIKPHDPRFTVAPLLWTFFVGSAGTMKGALLGNAMVPLANLQQQEIARHKAAMPRYEQDRKEWEVWRKASTNPVAGGVTELKLEPAKPPKRTFFMNNLTTQQAPRRVAQNGGRGVTLHFDELTSWIGSHDRYLNNGTPGVSADRGFWLTAWAGGPYSEDQRTGGEVEIPWLQLGVTGGIQPGKLAEIGKNFSDDGLFQRGIICQTYRKGEETIATLDPLVEAAYSTLIGHVAGLDPAALNGPIQMSPEAFGVFNELWREIKGKADRRADMKRDDDRLIEHFDKWQDHLARLTLVFHAIDSAGDVAPDYPSGLKVEGLQPRMRPVVTRETAVAACDFARQVLLPASLAVYEMIFERYAKMAGAEEVLLWLLAEPSQPIFVKVRDVQRGVRRLRGDATATQAAMRVLSDLGEFIAPAKYLPGNSVAAWHVNPEIWATYGAIIPTIRARRQAAHEAMRRDK